jgi:hypothetical protein
MNCCDYECNQGRDCPARKPTWPRLPEICPTATATATTPAATPALAVPADVAKVGKRMQAAEPLRGASWRREHKHLARALLLCVAVMFISAMTVALVR